MRKIINFDKLKGYPTNSYVFLWVILCVVVALVHLTGAVLISHVAGDDIHAAASCRLGTVSVSNGSPISISHNGFAAGESIKLKNVLTQYQQEIGKTKDSLSFTANQSIVIPPNIPAGQYKAMIVTRYPIMNFPCLGGPVTISPPLPLNKFKTEYFNNPDLTGLALTREEDSAKLIGGVLGAVPVPELAKDGSFSVRWEGRFSMTGGKYRFNASPGYDTVKVFVDGKPLVSGVLTQNALLDISAGDHVVKYEYSKTLIDKPYTFLSNFFDRQVCYDLNGDSNISSVDQQLLSKHTGASGETPWDLNFDGTVNTVDMGLLSANFGKKCPYAPTSYTFTLSTPTFNGNNVTFTFSPAITTCCTYLYVYDQNGAKVASPTQSSENSYVWPNAPLGTYTAALFTSLNVQASNKITFAVDGYKLAAPTFNGNNVTFTFSPAITTCCTYLYVYDQNGAKVASPTQSSENSYVWPNAPLGTYTAALFTSLNVQASNKITFAVDGYKLAAPTFNGNNVTFTFSPAITTCCTYLYVYDQNGAKVASPTQSSENSYVWPNAPLGTYTAALFTSLNVQASNKITFAVGVTP